jgi:hypothetical protein
MSDLEPLGYLDADDPLFETFSMGRVPLLSLIPVEWGFVVQHWVFADRQKLTSQQTETLLKEVLSNGPDFFASEQEADEYLVGGIPILYNRFESFETSDADELNELFVFQYNQYWGFPSKEIDEEDEQ